MLARKAAQADGKQGSLILRQPDGSRPRLLLAEDCDPVRVVTAAMLKGMGCDVDAVVHGEEAVEQAAASRFDVIVLDIEMPIMDGITAARSIRRLQGPSRPPIMALSAFVADAMQSAHWKDTFDIALPKPANRAELHAAVRAALDYRRPVALAAPVGSEPLLSESQTATLRAGLPQDVWRELTGSACRDIEDCVARINRVVSGAEAGSVWHLAEKLAAIGKAFAAPRLAVAARQVEAALADGDRVAAAMLADVAEATVAALRAS